MYSYPFECLHRSHSISSYYFAHNTAVKFQRPTLSQILQPPVIQNLMNHDIRLNGVANCPCIRNKTKIGHPYFGQIGMWTMNKEGTCAIPSSWTVMSLVANLVSRPTNKDLYIVSCALIPKPCKSLVPLQSMGATKHSCALVWGL